MRVLVCWIAMQGLIVINFLPARIMMYGIPLGGLVLLSIVGEFTMQNTMSNLGGSITGAITCSRFGFGVFLLFAIFSERCSVVINAIIHSSWPIVCGGAGILSSRSCPSSQKSQFH